MAEKLNNLYKSILSFASMKANADGKVMLDYIFDEESEKEDFPVKIEGRELVLPTEAQLKAYHPEKVVVFHPLQEFVNRGESEVVKLLRYQLNVRLNYTILVVASGLLKLVTSPALHRQLTPEQRELLLAVKASDVTLPARFTEFCVKHYTKATSSFFCNIYLKKAGTFQGQKHARVGVVHFPYYDLFEQEDIKFKKGDAEVFKSILTFMFPDSDTPNSEAYNNFSDHRDAPWLDCLLKTSYNIAQRLNELVKLYNTLLDPGYKTYLFEDSWVEPMENLEPYRAEIRMIPSQKGNEGSLEVDGKEVSTLAPVREGVMANTVPARREVPTTVPAVRTVPQVNQPTYHQPTEEPVFDRFGRCLNPPPVPAITPDADGKIDFRAIKANNPMVQMAAMTATPLTQWQESQNFRQQGRYYDPRQQQQPMVDGWGRPINPPPPQMYQHQQYQQQYHNAPPGPGGYGQYYDPRYDNRRGGPGAGFVDTRV